MSTGENIESERSSVEVRISNDRGRCYINVSGDMDIAGIKRLYRNDFSDNKSTCIVDCMMTTSPEGYTLIVSGHKSLREYLSDRQVIDCSDVFLMCKRICELFNICKDIHMFENILFDYNTVFVDSVIEKTLFVHAPYSASDDRLHSCSKLIELMYMYTNDDIYDNRRVKELVQLISEWEKSKYDILLFQKLSDFVQLYINLLEEKKNKDVFFKSSVMLKRFIENDTDSITEKTEKQKNCITFTSGLTRKHKQYICDSTNCCNEQLVAKIGRNKSWADIHIPDMTVGGRHAVVLFKDRCFYIRQISNIGRTGLNGIDINCGDDILLHSGSSVVLGRSTYKVRIS